MTVGNKACLNSTGYEFIRINSPKKTSLEIENFFKNKDIFAQFMFQSESINVNLAEKNEDIVKSAEELFINTIFLKISYLSICIFQKTAIQKA